MVKLIIEWTYKTKQGATTLLQSAPLSAVEALLFVEDIEQTGRVKELLMVDEHDSSWTHKELRKYLKEIETEPHHIRVYFDGGFHQETHEAGLGIVIYYEQNGKSLRKRLNVTMSGLTSNNEAEYAALEAGVTTLLLLQVHHQTVEFLGDSQVVISQMSGEWPVYEQELARWANQIDGLLLANGIEAVYTHIPRKENMEADRLASQALEGIFIEAEIELLP